MGAARLGGERGKEGGGQGQRLGHGRKGKAGHVGSFRDGAGERIAGVRRVQGKLA
ncbi:hypothetical protein MACH21_01360 [Roseicyclus marinus]|uniref:Uncharacterized protein n=1 Tax=Roseicyclus marinus TaxID=2161673 RepID=A0AA48GZT7_9RHOB|nr:hypothetical protein MACH21_01360 [Roseicyclus marinus]